ncbi:Tim44 domain-containing protein [Endothiovibrio diazotrophicus]
MITRKILLLTLTFFIGLGLIAADAQAKRLGGGGSFGMKRPLYSQPQRQQAPVSTPYRQTATPARSGMSRWLGPLAGLAAGGLLASLFFGDAFQGFQPMDLLLLLGVGAAIFFFMRSRRPQPARAAMGGGMGGLGGDAGGQFRAASEEPHGGFETPTIGGGLRGEAVGAASGPADALPSWFDREHFLRQAKVHFVRLQAAWDSGDMKEIREFTTPELFAELTLERHEITGENFTEVVELEAELAGFGEEAGSFVASVHYRGLIREERDATANPFSEVWHIVRAGDDPQAEWFVAGIEQAR